MTVQTLAIAAGVSNEEFWRMTPRDAWVAIKSSEYRDDRNLVWVSIIASAVEVNSSKVRAGISEGLKTAIDIFPRWKRWRNDD